MIKSLRLQLTAWPDRLPRWETPSRWPELAARDQIAAEEEDIC